MGRQTTTAFALQSGEFGVLIRALSQNRHRLGSHHAPARLAQQQGGYGGSQSSTNGDVASRFLLE